MDIAIVGCGMIADAHVQEIQKIADTKIIAVCDKEAMMAEQLADRYDIPNHYSSIEELLIRHHPDVMHILTPPKTHLMLIFTALESGCHVLVEKPFTVTMDEAKQAIEKAKSVDKKLLVNHFHNFSPPALRLRSIIKKGILGDIVHIESYYGYSLRSPVALALIQDKNSWLYDLPGKLLQNNISHLIAKISEFIPETNPKILTHVTCLSEELRKSNERILYDELRIIIAGQKVTAYATFSANIKPLLHFTIIYGTKGTLSVDYESRTLVYQHSLKIPGQLGKLISPFSFSKQFFFEGIKNTIKFAKSDFHYYSGMNKLLSLYYDCIKNNTELPISYQELFKVYNIMEAIFHQINR